MGSVSDKNAVALAGEFAVLSQLALANLDANMTLGRTKGVDILVSNPRTKKMYRLEVKTKLRRTDRQEATSRLFGTTVARWMMNKKHETRTDPLLFYCFVIIWKRTKKFRFFIIPSKLVAHYVKKQHDLFCAARKRKTKTVVQTDMRAFRIGFKKNTYTIPTPCAEDYEDNWGFSE